MDKIRHWQVLSSIKSNDLTPFMTTSENDEVIVFTDDDGNQRTVNSLTIWTDSTALYIELSDDGDGHCIYIPANSSVSLDYLALKQIKVLALAGASLRYLAMYY